MREALPLKDVLAPAKVNIRLKVTGRRPDGYHELVSLLVPVSLFDRIQLQSTRSGGIRLDCSGFPVPTTPDNLICRAAQAFFSRTGLQHHLHLRLEKNIPVSAGLGGGSSDAASTLMALNDLWGNPLSFESISEIALSLGADVPFFLHQRPCIARGIGEILEPTGKWPLFQYVIITPHIQVSTAWAYRNLKLELTTDEYNFIISVLERGPVDLTRLLENDLERVTASHFPVIGTIKKSLIDAGAVAALMSGSGPSVFGIFESKAKALGASRHLASQDLGNVFAVEQISQGVSL